MQSTLFNAICENSKAQAANFPFCTIEPNVGIVAVPDSRLQVCRSFEHLITTLHSTARRAFCLVLLKALKGYLTRLILGNLVQVLSELSKSTQIVPTSVEFVDIAGLVKGASKGEGLGNQFLANIRECDAIAQVPTPSCHA